MLDPEFLNLVHPALRGAAEAVAGFSAQFPPYADETIVAHRAITNQLGGDSIPDGVSSEEIAVPGGGTARIFIVNAKPGTPRIAILHTHGGGFIAGTAMQSLPSLVAHSEALDCVIVTVEYDLAPEATYAISSEQNYAALKWLHANAVELGADPDRIAVMGESAGGGHAALLAVMARDRGEVPVAFQCLVQPMLDDQTASSRPVPSHIGKVGWTPESNRYAWGAYLGQPAGTDSVPAGAVPSRTPDLTGLPPAYIAVGALDLFVEESMEYARRLIAAGVRTELIVVPGAIHGFDVFAPEAEVSKDFVEAARRAYRRELG